MISFREFQESDTKELQIIFNEFGDFFTQLDPMHLVVRPDNYGEFYLNQTLHKVATNGKFMLAEQDHLIVGFIAGRFFEITADTSPESLPHRKGRVEELFVRSSYRGQGIGEKLMQQMLSFFQENNCLNVNIEVFGPNTRALHFYQKLGFNIRNYDLIKTLTGN